MVSVVLFGAADKRRRFADVLARSLGFTQIVVSDSKSDVSDAMQRLDVAKNVLQVDSVESAVEHIHSHWREHFVATFDLGEDQLELFSKRPFALLVALIAEGAPLSAEYLTFTHRTADLVLFLRNTDSLGKHAAALDLCNPSWLRPSWDAYFMRMAYLASSRSNCMKRRIGAILVRDSRVVATGYNGTARSTVNCFEGGCRRCNANTRRGVNLSECLCLHAEENALLEADAQRAKGATLYSTTEPCLGCAKKIVQMGVQRVVYEIRYAADHDSREYLLMANVAVDQFDGGATPRFVVIG